MFIKTLTTLIHAEHDTLWNLLLDRVTSPERFIPEVTEARITEKQGNICVREMMLHGERVKEKITIYPYESRIDHELIEHPQFTGTIVTKVVRTARQSPVAPQNLEYDIDLSPRSRIIKGVLYGEAEIVADLETEMQHLKLKAEEIESRA